MQNSEIYISAFIGQHVKKKQAKGYTRQGIREEAHSIHAICGYINLQEPAHVSETHRILLFLIEIISVMLNTAPRIPLTINYDSMETSLLSLNQNPPCEASAKS